MMGGVFWGIGLVLGGRFCSGGWKVGGFLREGFC